MILDPLVIAAAQAHAIAEFPREACGVVTSAGYVPLPNIASDPYANFRIDEYAILGVDVLAVLHSHPNGPAHPSSVDMAQQIATGVPWGIIVTDGVGALPPVMWGDFLLDSPLLGRPFIHGVTDCFSLIRAWFWQEKGVYLADIPRNDLWWEDGGNLYLENFVAWGFTIVDRDEARYGDVFLSQVASRTVNHGGVILDDGLCVHHLTNRLSLREPLFRWRRFMTHIVRYVNCSIDRRPN